MIIPTLNVFSLLSSINLTDLLIRPNVPFQGVTLFPRKVLHETTAIIGGRNFLVQCPYWTMCLMKVLRCSSLICSFSSIFFWSHLSTFSINQSIGESSVKIITSSYQPRENTPVLCLLLITKNRARSTDRKARFLDPTSVTRLSPGSIQFLETRGFPSPPHDGFGFIGIAL